MKIKKRKLTVLIILSLLIGLGILRWRSFGKGDQEPTYTTAQVEKGTIVSTISANGNLILTNTFVVTTSVTGVVKEIFVSDGEGVTEGQKLVVIELDEESQEAQSKAWVSYLAAKNTLAAAQVDKLNLKKGVEEAKGNLINTEQAFEEDWDSTEYWDDERKERWSDLKAAEIALEIAEQKYKNVNGVIAKAVADLNVAELSYENTTPTIVAPQAGTITSISVAEGIALSSSEEQASRGQKILAISKGTSPLVSVSVSEIDIGKVTVEQKGTLTFDALPDKTFTGKVVSVDRTGTQTQSVVSYPVLIRLDTGEALLHSNMSATAEIITEVKENVIWIPPQAIKMQAGRTFVRVLVNGEPQDKQVEVGLETVNKSEVTSGLSEGETVIVSEQLPGGAVPTFGGGGGFMRMMR